MSTQLDTVHTLTQRRSATSDLAGRPTAAQLQQPRSLVALCVLHSISDLAQISPALRF